MGIPSAAQKIRFFRIFLYALLLSLLSISGFSQNVGINAAGTAPNAAAGLDVDFPNKGVLIPRVALTGTGSFAPLSAHVAGMIVYNTATIADVTPGFYYNDGTRWIGGLPSGTATGDMLYWNGTAWVMLPVGLPGQFLQISGTNLPSWGGAAVSTISTTAASAITGISATSGGNITSDGGSAILNRGVCWNTATGPTIANTKTSDGTGTGVFTSSLTALLPVTTYYVRAYAINSTTISYGNEITFTTLPVLATLAATTAATSITGSTAISGGNVTATGGAPITERGICYGTTSNPTTAGSKVTDPSPGPGVFTSNIGGLLSTTTYYVRSYAINSAGTAYGTQISFRTLPSLTTAAPTAIAPGGVTSGGVLTAAGGTSAIWYYGVAWATTPNAASPTYVQTGTFPATSPVTFTTNITGLTANTTYYIRAYAQGQGPFTAFGPELSFTTTSATAPVVGHTTAISGKNANIARSGGIITTDGGSPITAKGVCWGTTPNPTVGTGNFTSDGTGTATFVSNITGLTGNTVYYLRAYARNIIGTSYAPVDVTFKTWVQAIYSLGQNVGYGICAYVDSLGHGFIVSPDIPSTAPWGCSGTSIATSTALGSGQANTSLILASCATRPIAASVAASYNGGGFNDWFLPSDGEWQILAANYTMFGFPGPYVNYLTSSASSLTYAGSYFYTGSQAYYMGSPRTGGDTYATYIRAIRLFAGASVPTVTTDAVTAITATGATTGGNVVSDGGASVTARGVCWSTSTGPTIANPKTSDGTGTGAFVSTITGLTTGTTYYIRAYATNSTGTAYGSEISITPGVTVLVPVVTTDPIGSIVGSVVEGNYTVVSEALTPVTSAGLVWGTSTGATITTHAGMAVDPYYYTGSTGMSFPLQMTGLTIGTTYYVRAFATNTDGTGYGAEITVQAVAATLGQNVQLNYQSGVVFSVSGGGAHGLIGLSYSPGSLTDWGCTNSATGATATVLGTGSANTATIIANILANTCASASGVGGFAAEVSGWYGTEWYLPSKDELNLLWTNRALDATGTLSANMAAAIAVAPIWSSSEVNATMAWYFNGTAWFNTGTKTTVYNVWPVRSF